MPRSTDSRVSERRSTRRVELALEVKVWRGDTTIAVSCPNLSVGGLKLVFTGVDVSPPFTVGERIDLEFQLPLLPETVITKGEVRWLEAESCGVQFTALHPRVVSAINRLHAGSS